MRSSRFWQHILVAAAILSLAGGDALAQQQRNRARPAAPGATAAPAQSTAGLTPDTQARQAIVLDFKTGDVLFEKNADERMPPSSMSKTMTAYMAFKAIKEGRLQLDSKLPVSQKAW